MHRLLRTIGIATLLLVGSTTLAAAATRGLRIKNGSTLLVEVVDGVSTGEISIEPGESLALEVFWLDETLSEFQPASPPFSMAGDMASPAIATYSALGDWTFEAAAVGEGMTELTLELRNNGNPEYTSPGIEVHVEPAFEAEGLVLRHDGNVLAVVWQGVATGEVPVEHEQIEGPIEVTFLDADSVEFSPTDPAFELRIEVADTTIARVSSFQNWNFSLEGLVVGMTTLQVKVFHEEHFDFVSPDIEVHVEEPFEADGLVIRQGGSTVMSLWQGQATGLLTCIQGADSDTFEVVFLDPDSVEFTPDAGEGFSLVVEVAPGTLATASGAGDWRFRLHGSSVGSGDVILKVAHEAHFDFESPGLPLRVFPVLAVGDPQPRAIEFAGATPNPVASRTLLRFMLPRAMNVRLAVFDVSGREISRVADGAFGAGEHRVEWSAPSLPAGIYFARLVTPSGTFTRRVTVAH